MFRFYFALIFLSVTKTEFISLRRNCRNTEFECDSRDCIPKSAWCAKHWRGGCYDGSHVRDCNRHYPNCKSDQGYCLDTKKCIPIRYLCDGHKDCNDNSDEKECLNNRYRIIDIDGVMGSRINAKSWFIKQRESNWGWRKDTNRAITALLLSDPEEYPPGNPTRELMVKQLQIQLSETLLRSGQNSVPLHEMALYVHALLAACLDPRNFQGYDLVQMLQREITSEYVNPLVALTICNSNGTIPVKSINELVAILQSPNEPQWIDLKALATMALICGKNKSETISIPFPQNRNDSNIDFYIPSLNITDIRKMFEELQRDDGSFGNLYTTVFVVQALLALEDHSSKWNVEKSFKYLISKQKNDGSFGDILATYLALPIMYGRTFANLRSIKCSKEFIDKENLTVKEELDSMSGKRFGVEYLIYVGETKDIAFGIKLNVPVNVTFFDVMRLAAELDGRYKFKYVEYPWGKHIYSIFNIVNDPEARKFWELYEINQKLIFVDKSPVKVIIKENTKYIYWYKLSNRFAIHKFANVRYETEE